MKKLMICKKKTKNRNTFTKPMEEFRFKKEMGFSSY